MQVGSCRKKMKLLKRLEPYAFNTILVILFQTTCINQSTMTVYAQSIGYQPQFNLGFNPYYSPVFGYGLGLPYGAYKVNPFKHPWLLNSIGVATPFSPGNALMGKVHAKALFNQLTFGKFYGSVKDKLNVLKHPQYAFSPYGTAYGYGKHYGAAVVPNNPYKGTYSDYYENSPSSSLSTSASSPVKHSVPLGYEESHLQHHVPAAKLQHKFKPLLKAGALLTTAALLGKKVLGESSMKLNPSGMILNGAYPI